MATRKQRAANRRNAQFSTGPVTPEGKAAVRLNALQHGFTSENATIFDEDEDAFDELRNTFLDHLQPAGPLETGLVHQIVMAQWRLARLRRLETGLFNLAFADHEDDIKEEYTKLTPRGRLAYVFRRNTDPLSTFGRYEARIERAFYRALHELQRLQAARQQPDPPPPAKTNSAEQTQIAPRTDPNPLPQNGLPPVGEPTSPRTARSAGFTLPQFAHRMDGICTA
jgi:hypothetical protein